MRQQAQFQTTSTLAECFLAYIKQIPKQCTRQNHPSPHLALHPFLLLKLIGKLKVPRLEYIIFYSIRVCGPLFSMTESTEYMTLYHTGLGISFNKTHKALICSRRTSHILWKKRNDNRLFFLFYPLYISARAHVTE